MISYLLIILISFNAIALLNSIPWEVAVGEAYLDCSLTVAATFCVDAAVAILVRFYPEKKLNPFAKIFVPTATERKIHRILGVRVWKDYIPETGKFLCHFAKDKIAEPDNNEYVLRFLRETCYASVMHAISIFACFLLVPILPFAVSITLPVVTVNAFLQALPVLVQRYNRPRLIALYRRNAKREELKV